jgi:hypothetical protein
MKNLNFILMLSFFISTLNACNFSQTIPVNKEDKTPLSVNKSSNNSKSDTEDLEKINEITSCSPEKIYKGENLTISFEKNHGENFAIISEKTRDYYFLTLDDTSYFPIMPPDKFGELLTLELKTSKVSILRGETRNGVFFKSKPFFTRTGWYLVLIGHQELDVDFEDAILRSSGRCRVYYVNKKRPKKK